MRPPVLAPEVLFAAQERAPIGMALLELSGPVPGTLIWVNRALCRMLRYTDGDLLGKSIAEITHPDDLERDLEQVARLMGGEANGYEIEKRLLRSDGEVCWVQLHASLVGDRSVTPLYGIGQVVDITPLKDATAGRAAVIDSALDAVVTAQADGTIIEFNPAAERMFGYPAEEAIGQTIALITPPSLREPLDLVFRGELDDVLDRRIQVHARRADGHLFPVELAITRMQETPRTFTGFFRDMRRQRAVEQALEDSERRYRQIVESTSEGISVLDENNITTFANQRFAEMLGYEREEILGRSTLEFMDDEAKEFARTRLARRREGVGEHYRTRLLHKDGQTVWVSISGNPLFDELGEYTGSLGLFTDVTDLVKAEEERERLQDQLNQAQRLETVGLLAGGVAHDFNNLLSVIQGYAELAAVEVADRPGAVEAVEEIKRATGRAAALTRRLLTLSRRDVAQPEVVDLREIVSDVRRLLARTLGKHVDLRLEFPDELPPVAVDVKQLEQVLLNLAVNARDAMPDGGELRIELSETTGGPGGRQVRLSVEDTGTGMPPDVLERAFDPFFTTKPAAEGTGLGLPTVYGIITQSGGQVTIDSELGRGTRVLVQLPAVAAEVASKARGDEVDPAPANGQTILLVDDEDAVRR